MQNIGIGAVENFTLNEDDGGTLSATWDPPINSKYCNITYTLQKNEDTYTTSDLFYNFGTIVPCHNYKMTIYASVDNSNGTQYEEIYTGDVKRTKSIIIIIIDYAYY